MRSYFKDPLFVRVSTGMAPQRLGELLVERHKLRLLPPPMKLPSYAVKQHWHERYHHDPANQWLRGVVAKLFLE